MTRILSRFTCHNLKHYPYKHPPNSQLIYQNPLRTKFSIETGSPAHRGPHSGAIDFVVPPQTPVYAARSGKVIELVNLYSIPFFLRIPGNYLLTRLYRGQMNYLTLEHNWGEITEFSFYAHLKKSSFKVKLGQKVKQGQILAKSGWSGWMDKPHLHFVIYTEKTKDYPKETHQSLTPKWQNQS